MKTISSTICAAALAATALLTACDDNFTRPPVILPPVTDIESTIALADYKNLAWSTIASGPQQVGFLENGDSIIFIGRVCSSDESGNIYKNIVVQGHDASGEQVALTFSVNAYDLYALFPFGQEVAVYATGLQVGPYRNLLQFGAISGDQMTFMDESDFKAHMIRNGSPMPQPEKVDTTLATIPQVIAAKGNSADLCKWQSRLVKFENVQWVEAGQPYAGAQTVNRYIKDADGNRLVVRNSSYADFSDELIPYGTGTVTGILSYFSNDWQLLLIDINSCIGFDNIAPEIPEVKPEGEGTAASPFNVAAALAKISAMSQDDSYPAYVKGIIVGIDNIDTSFGNATYTIADVDGGATMGVYRGYWFNGDKFTSADQMSAGASVVISGTLVNYKGNTPQFTTGSRVISYNGQTSGGGSGNDTPAGAIYTALGADEAQLSAGWTIVDVALGGATKVWDWREYSGAHYLNGSGFVNSTALATESYAVSPAIDLSGVTGCYLTFDHAAKFQTTLRTLCGVCAREDGATEWTDLAIPVWPEAGSWTFASSGNVSLAQFDGKKIQIAFRYKSSTAGADTWEIKNLAVGGNK